MNTTNVSPVKTLRPCGQYAYTVSPECMTPDHRGRPTLDIPFYYVAGLSSIVKFVNPIDAYNAGRTEAIPYVSLI